MNKAVFSFTDYDIEIELAGHTFSLDCSSDTGDKLKEIGEQLNSLTEAYEKGEKTKEDICDFGKNAIDILLGENAAEKLLKGRKHLISDITDIIVFLSETVATFQAERRSQALNRAQRRAMSKAQKK